MDNIDSLLESAITLLNNARIEIAKCDKPPEGMHKPEDMPMMKSLGDTLYPKK